MQTIQLNDVNHVRAFSERPAPTYVFYTGGIAGVSDLSDLKGDSEGLDGGADQVQLQRERVDRV